MAKNLKLLRKLDFDKLKPGDALCDTLGRPDWIFVAGPDTQNRVICQYKTTGTFNNPISVDELRMVPLAWVEDRPVYCGDMLYHTDYGKITALASRASGQVLIAQGVERDLDLYIKGCTWEPVKIKREGWINIYESTASCRRNSSHIYLCKEDADNVAAPDRIACVPVTWEE